MYGLSRIVISPKQLPGVITVKWLLGDLLLGEYLKSEVVYNLLDGTMSTSSGDVVSRIKENLTTKVQISRSHRENTDKKWTLDEVHQMIKERKEGKINIHDEMAINDLISRGPKENNDLVEVLGGVKLQLVVALASHQVNGDQIVKGLKAQGIQVDVKFQESFLGGWNITDGEGNRLDVESVLRMIPS